MAKEASSCDFSKLTGETSLHGIRFIGNKEIATTRRCLWIILVSSSILILSFTLYLSISKYYSFPVTTVISIYPNKMIAFPAVTFCNYNQIRASKLSEEEKYFFDHFRESSFNITPYNNLNFTEMLYKLSHPIEDILVHCLWQFYYPCGPENFTTHLYDFGVCYTFNGNSNRPLNIVNAGSRSGLKLQIDINQTECTDATDEAAGIKMLIHPQDEHPLVTTYGFSIAPGFLTQIALTGVYIKNLPDPYPSNCTNKPLKYSNVYTEALCIDECKSEYVAEKCGCRHSTMLGDVPECSPEDAIKCAYYEDVKFFSAGDAHCDCPIACKQMFYNKRVSSAAWPSKTKAEKMQAEHGYTAEYISENLLEVAIYFEELSFQVTEEVAAYSRLQLFSEIGGNMGLLCGMSIITVIEFLEFGIIAAIQRFCRGKNNKVTNPINVSTTK
ncbi:acid-sensing ion channel 1A-like [Anneissia japonica]|uniref:acid-sensing ion channel 1A-like n=1 Tax=Anneissia japonica TaxID=1529436 RepID=UPI001425BA9A|nr:acid-sensing ion channel 1A-like [Anneissia japonica]